VLKAEQRERERERERGKDMSEERVREWGRCVGFLAGQCMVHAAGAWRTHCWGVVHTWLGHDWLDFGKKEASFTTPFLKPISHQENGSPHASYTPFYANYCTGEGGKSFSRPT
jgi:hypothetical protein